VIKENKMKKTILIIAVILFVVGLSATDFKHSLGFAGGMISGSGFAYRQMNDNYGFQVTFGVISNDGYNDDWDDDDYYFYNEDYTYEYNPEYSSIDTTEVYSEYGANIKNLMGNIGFSYYKPLHRGQKSMFYLLAGSSVYFARTEDKMKDFQIETLSDTTYHYVEIANEYTETTQEILINAGVGIGMEYNITKNIVLSFEWPLVFQKNDDEFNIFMYIPQGGIHYYF
jgi:hypothetical protein